MLSYGGQFNQLFLNVNKQESYRMQIHVVPFMCMTYNLAKPDVSL